VENSCASLYGLYIVYRKNCGSFAKKKSTGIFCKFSWRKAVALYVNNKLIKTVNPKIRYNH